MKLWVFFLASVVVWWVLRFLAGNRIRKTLISGTPEEKIRAVGQMPVVGLLGWVALLSAVSSGGLLVAAGWLNRQGGSTLAEFEALLHRLTGARDWLAQFSVGWLALVGLIAFI